MEGAWHGGPLEGWAVGGASTRQVSEEQTRQQAPERES